MTGNGSAEQQRKAQLDAFGSDRGTIDVLAMLRRAGPPFRRSAVELTQSSLGRIAMVKAAGQRGA